MNGVDVLDQTRAFIRRWVVLTDAQATELALWVAHTYALESAESTPYQHIYSAEKASGKTRLLEVLELLVMRPWFTSSTTSAALVREIDTNHPTLLLDESDAAFARDREYAEALRGVLNAGFRKGGTATICVGQGASISTKKFDVFCPKAIAGIGRLPDTVASRSLPIRLKRKSRDEQVERFRRKLVEPAAKELKKVLAAWVKSVLSELSIAEADLPEALTDRQQDVTEPLLTLADAAGGHWPTEARAALIELCTGGAAEDDSLSTKLLADIQTLFSTREASEIPSTELVDAMNEIETAPWGELNYGKPLKATGLARLLKKFEIEPKTMRFGDRVCRGYVRRQFEDAWDRYLPRVGKQTQQVQQCSTPASSETTRAVQQVCLVADGKGPKAPRNKRVVADVALAETEVAADGLACWVHPTNKIDWWRREQDLVCGRCHPNPSSFEE